MSKLKPSKRLDHFFASRFQTNAPLIQKLQREGKLPTTGTLPSLEAASLNPFEQTELQHLELYRFVLDTAVEPFARDLQNLASELQASYELPFSKSLTEFRQHGFDSSPEAPLYPVDKFQRPWRGHRVPILQAELRAAGYGEFFALWNRHPDPFYTLPVNGQVPLGPDAWMQLQQTREELRPRRANFIQNLAVVLQLRTAVIQ